MAACTWNRKVNGNTVQVCGLEQQAESTFCPRHTYLYNLAEKEKWERAEQRREKNGEAMALGGTPRNRLQHCGAGYVFEGSSRCACGKPIEWWRTPKMRNAPYDPMPEETSLAVSHFVTCTRRSTFRKAS